MSDSNKNKCPHCDKTFIKLNQHITKSHHQYEFILLNHSEHDYIESIKMIHTFPDGKKEELVFNRCGSGNNDRVGVYDCIEGTVYYDEEAKKIRLVVSYKRVNQYETRNVDVHLGRYKITTPSVKI